MGNVYAFESPQKIKRDLGTFNGISLAIKANVHLKQGNNYSFEIEAEDKVLEELKTEVHNGVLTIKFENRTGLKNYNTAEIYITMPDIKYLGISGSGDITAETPVVSEGIHLRVTGSGSINIDDLKAREVESDITGSGDIYLDGHGKIKEVDVDITGSGDFKANGVEFGEGDVLITGSGNCYLIVTGELDASITGSGSIYYQGNPLIDANIVGSGKLRHKD